MDGDRTRKFTILCSIFKIESTESVISMELIIAAKDILVADKVSARIIPL
jgi:hypothetical protein